MIYEFERMNFKLLNVVASYKYLGHYLIDDRSDDEDRGSINRQRRTLFVQGNIIINVRLIVQWCSSAHMAAPFACSFNIL